jgi:hypothetical protein
MTAPLTATMISQLNRSNAAMQRASVGTLLGRLSPAGYVFYVDGNFGDDGNNGASWGSPFKTLAYGLAASTTAIASGAFGWAARNVIYCKADSFVEDLVLLAPKTDVIGCGSLDRFPYCGLVGNHVPTGVTASYGTRFFNFMFAAPAAGGDIWTLDTYNAWLEFNACRFSAQSTTAATGAVVATAASHLRLVNNSFMGRFSDAVIELGTGDARGTLISGNHIEGANQGIHLNSGTTDSAGATEEYIYIENNTISTATEGIYDEADIARINNNTVSTLQAKGAGGAGAIVGNEYFSGGNKISASNLANADWPALGTL